MKDRTVSTKGIQVVYTPENLLLAINERWPIHFDLAVDREEKAALGLPCITEDSDAFSYDWFDIWSDLSSLYNSKRVYLFLNPPFSQIPKWFERCEKEAKKGARIVSLVPASTGTKWFINNARVNAMSYILDGRATFIGHDVPYPKDLMTCIWGDGMTGLAWWKW